MIEKDLAFFILSITLIISAVAFATSELIGTGTLATAEEVIFIEEEMTRQELLDSLNEKGLIKNQITYGVLSVTNKIASLLGSDSTVDRGGYAFGGNLSASAIVSSLQQPEYRYVSVIEGMRKEEIAEKVGTALNWEESEIKTFKGKYPICSFVGKEGYLAPGDYLIKSDAAIQEIQQKMQERFSEKIDQLKIDHENVDIDKIITIASMIQRESGGKSDMRLISGVIWNRLDLGMPLQIDATLQYVKGDDDLWWPSVESRDKYIESPFNTYQNPGLPPQPIANPGPAAIEAALDPLDTECLFYLHDKSGTIHCASDYEGHKENIKRYLQ